MFLLYIYNRKTKIYCFFFSKSGLSLGWLVLCVCGLQLVVPAGLFNSHRSIPHRFLAGSPGQQQLPSPPPASFLSLCLARLLALLPLCFGYRLFDGVRVVLQKLNPVLPQQFSGQQLVLWKQVDKKKREKKDRKKGIKGKWQKNRAERESKNKTALSGKITVSDILNEIQFVSLYQRNCFFCDLLNYNSCLPEAKVGKCCCQSTAKVSVRGGNRRQFDVQRVQVGAGIF